MNPVDTLSEQYIREHCPHCDSSSDAFAELLFQTEFFRVVCDHHPLCEGHVLIIPKAHLSCIGEYPDDVLDEFQRICERMAAFIRKNYGHVSTFEHGKIGQTVFHSHIHLLPFAGRIQAIVPEGPDAMISCTDLKFLRDAYAREGQYLYVSIDHASWTVDTALGAPRFFRDRFARALGNPERGNWKTMHGDAELMRRGQEENAKVAALWQQSQNRY